MRNKIGKTISIVDMGGLSLLTDLLLDKVFKSDYFNGHCYQILRNADKKDYPRLLKDLYGIQADRDLNLDNPKTYNEKIQWIKVYDVTSKKTLLTDKYLVRNWVKSILGESYLIPLLGVWSSFDEIDFSSLPDSFVLKCNHGSGFCYTVRHKNRIDMQILKYQFDKWMKYNFAFRFLELQYRDIVPKIIAEEYIEQSDGNLIDYKIHVFNGEPKIIQVIGDRDLEKHTAKECFLTPEWIPGNLMSHAYDRYDTIPEKPSNLDKMLETAVVLGEGFKYVRVDLYNIDGQIKFGEMTFTPASGYGKWDGDEQYLVGSWINLS